MASISDLIEPLVALTHKCLDHHAFAYAENFCNLLNAVESGRWSQLPQDEQRLWLSRLADLIHVRALGDVEWALGDPDYGRVCHLCEGLRNR